MICPKCNKDSLIRIMAASIFDEEKYFCQRCGYQDTVMKKDSEEEKKELLKYRKMFKKISTAKTILNPKDGISPKYLYVYTGGDDVDIFVKMNNLSPELREMIKIEMGE